MRRDRNWAVTIRCARHSARLTKTGRDGFYRIVKVRPGSFILAFDFVISALTAGRSRMTVR